MPQVLKPEVRNRIVHAALEVFAAQGYTAATMATIAERAGLATGSLYRYYPGKTELFAAAIPNELVDRFSNLLTRRVRALGASSLNVADPSGEEMLRFWLDHRLEVVILLDRAEGTPHAAFGARFVTTLVDLTQEQIAWAYPSVILDGSTRFVLRHIFEHTRRMLAVILANHRDEDAIRRAVEAFWAYQIAGLRGLLEHVGRSQPSPAS